MMYATKIRMRQGCTTPSLTEIDEIYLTGDNTDKSYKKEDLHDHLKKNPGTIKVNISPYPFLVPVTSSQGEKYVKSAPDNTTKDNLLNLPKF